MNSYVMGIMGGYMLSIFLFFNLSNSLVFWCFLEINMLFMIGMFFYLSRSDMMVVSEICFFYFLFQSLGSFLILISIKDNEMGFGYEDSNFFVLGAMIKLGLGPFFFWIYRLGTILDNINLFVLLSLQKIPLMMVVFRSPSVLCYSFLLLSFFLGSCLLFHSTNVTFLMISSSVYSAYWIALIYMFSVPLFLFYYLLYTILLYFCLVDSGNFGLTILSLGSYLFFLGLPPFGLFFYKVMITDWMLDYYSRVEITFFWLVSFLALFGYSKVFFQYFIMKFYAYSDHEKIFSNMSDFLIVLMSCLLFLCYQGKLYLSCWVHTSNKVIPW